MREFLCWGELCWASFCCLELGGGDGLGCCWPPASGILPLVGTTCVSRGRDALILRVRIITSVCIPAGIWESEPVSRDTGRGGMGGASQLVEHSDLLLGCRCGGTSQPNAALWCECW